MDLPIKLDDSSLNDFRDIGGADFVSIERMNIGEAYPNNAKRGQNLLFFLKILQHELKFESVVSCH